MNIVIWINIYASEPSPAHDCFHIPSYRINPWTISSPTRSLAPPQIPVILRNRNISWILAQDLHITCQQECLLFSILCTNLCLIIPQVFYPMEVIPSTCIPSYIPMIRNHPSLIALSKIILTFPNVTVNAFKSWIWEIGLTLILKSNMILVLINEFPTTPEISYEDFICLFFQSHQQILCVHISIN